MTSMIRTATPAVRLPARRHHGFLAGFRALPALALILAAGMAAAPARAAGEDAAGLMERWYAALEAADAEALGALMDDGATIVLDDLAITQTKPEFLDSMGEWADAIDGGMIRHRVKGGDGVQTPLRVAVCYRFASGEQLTQEDFTLADGRVLASRQAKIADDCAGF